MIRRGKPATTPTYNVVDSSAWIEYLIDGPNAGLFAPAIEDTERLIVPAISILEVFRWVLRTRGEDDALQVASLMQQATVVELDAPLALSAAKLGLAHRLPLADSIIYAVAAAHQATLWTQDADFDGLEGVQYRKKQTGP